MFPAATALLLAAGTITATMVNLYFRKRSITARTVFGLGAAAELLASTAAVLLGLTVLASIGAGTAAVCLWLWWHAGGGDGTRRRIRRWARRFQGVRRTAPAS